MQCARFSIGSLTSNVFYFHYYRWWLAPSTRMEPMLPTVTSLPILPLLPGPAPVGDSETVAMVPLRETLGIVPIGSFQGRHFWQGIRGIRTQNFHYFLRRLAKPFCQPGLSPTPCILTSKQAGGSIQLLPILLSLPLLPSEVLEVPGVLLPQLLLLAATTTNVSNGTITPLRSPIRQLFRPYLGLHQDS